MNAYLAARNPTGEGKDKIVTIYAEYSSKPKIKKVPTGIKVSAQHWDNTNKLIKANAKLTGAATVGEANQTAKTVLGGLNEAVKALYLANGNILPTVEQLNKYLAKAGETIAAIAAEETLVAELQKFAAHTSVANNWSNSTKGGFKSLVGIILDYEAAKKVTWYLSTLTNEEIVSWQQWVIDVYDYADSSLIRRVRTLQQFLLEKQPPKVNLKKVKAIYTQSLSAPVVLNPSEITALRQLDLSRNKRLERIRDLQQLQIWTGLRFSDLKTLSQHHVQTGQIVVKPQKTKKKNRTVTIPIFPPAREVLNKYTSETGELKLPSPSRQKFSAYMKELAELVPELRKPVTVETTKRNETTAKQQPKCELLSTHTNRRTFCTMLLDDGVPMKTVCFWSGHSTLTAFQRYLGRTESDNAIAEELMKRYS